MIKLCFIVQLIGLKNSKLHLQHELSNFLDRVNEFENLLETAISSQDFLHQRMLETQILEFKNSIDSSNSITEYLLESKYTQLQCIKLNGDIARDQYIEQQLIK